MNGSTSVDIRSFSECVAEEVGKEREGNNEEIAALIEPGDGRVTMSVPASERDSRKRAREGAAAAAAEQLLCTARVRPLSCRKKSARARWLNRTMKGAATRACALRALWYCARRAHAAARTLDRHETWHHGIGWNRDAASDACMHAFRSSCSACGPQALLAGGLESEVRDCTWALSLVRGS